MKKQQDDHAIALELLGLIGTLAVDVHPAPPEHIAARARVAELRAMLAPEPAPEAANKK